ncbi:D-aminoacyl-tRNA deacylase [Maridesulfovibrio hydrothermalis]|uniref:D-aminoacyl-tRNA deacylase n=1 Tax=Maridesulfovibrio hydrothermalis AM13 = DSM 14728 TaxID=1121451 RepID=L0RAQ2_9BACT|nr:D-aminoacyl-tRNA deacylase [Maridesulfovibrio hydrothermalis]CCO22651.1 D-Tyr-tRNATyr deacylase [Maridesulfovibrio hydrothermalis AM13 = DSM 14728]
MKLVIQRTSGGKVEVEGSTIGKIGPGIMVLAGFGKEDTEELPDSKVWKTLLDKMIGLRIFEDTEGRMNLSLEDIGGDILLVSQFTLYASCKKGRRPSFTGAAAPQLASTLFDKLVETVTQKAPGKVATGQFGAMMNIDFVNSGPVTIILDSNDFI